MHHYTTSEIWMTTIFLLIVASFTAYYAKQKGRNPSFWFFMGIMISFFAPLILWFLPSIKSDADSAAGVGVTELTPDPYSIRAPAKLSEKEEFSSEDESHLWYYLDEDHEQMGPVSVLALRELWNRGELELSGYVWSEGMEKWQRVKDLPELIKSLGEKKG